MLKRISLLVTTVFIWISGYAQDETKSIDLTVNNPNPVEIESPYCFLAVRANDYGNSTTEISVEIDNHTDNSIFLFGHAYSEKELKRQNIQFDKKAYGSTGRVPVVCEGVGGDNILQIKPGEKRVLTIDNIYGSTKKIELPLYIAKLKQKKAFGKEKYLIYTRSKIILYVTLIEEVKADNEYEDIKGKCDELITMIAQNPVCPNSHHPISRQKQIDDKKALIMDLKDEISDIKSKNRWRERDEAYQPYKELLTRLDNIEIKEVNCNQCQKESRPVRRHSCNYCSKSPSDILVELQRVYQKLDTRQIKKSEAIKAVEGAHKAWTGGCSNLKKKMSDDSVTKSKVEKYYNSIVNY